MRLISYSESFPWWPSVIYDEDHHGIPLTVLQDFKKERLKRKTKMYMVQFFDKNNSWSVGLVFFWSWRSCTRSRSCVPRDKILMLKEDDGQWILVPLQWSTNWRCVLWCVELDEEMLATSGPRQKWKTATLRSQCREAYRFVFTPLPDLMADNLTAFQESAGWDGDWFRQAWPGWCRERICGIVWVFIGFYSLFSVTIFRCSSL